MGVQWMDERKITGETIVDLAVVVDVAMTNPGTELVQGWHKDTH